ncbi:MAG: methyltransferase domain-containing protein [Alphaproteobacteria bacterium]|jgi:SAM-dependent methyltransferase|nr:methyltransferase domain-containing protein [Alphaproteobacteria bacterium]
MVDEPSYHLHHLKAAVQLLGGFEGGKVLEIGGRLPREVGLGTYKAAEWLSVDFPGYWHEAYGASGHPEVAYDGQVDSAVPGSPWSSWAGSVLDLPQRFDGYFDFAFSTCAFEHIADVKGALSAIHRGLRDGGRFFLSAMAIWPSSFGHHLPPVLHDGIELSYANPPFPPWSHLLQDREGMAALLEQTYPREVTERILHFVYDSPHINRHFVEDYAEALENAGFSESRLGHVEGEEPSADILGKLAERWGPRRYSDLGVVMLGHK